MAIRTPKQAFSVSRAMSERARAAELQPITEVYQDGGTVVVIVELPGADPDRVLCHASGARLRIDARGARNYRKELSLPATVAPDGLTQTVRNGILEVRLARMSAP